MPGPQAQPPLPIICLAGPTGAGKTALALALAKELDCEIINADSRQTYSDFPIITAQPDEGERKRAPHHLYAFLKTDEKLDAAAWARLAFAKAREIRARGRLPLLVGGSGFYFQSLLSSLSDIPPIPAEISAFFANKILVEGSPAAHKELARLDPDYAAKIHPNDRQRVRRALEVRAATGKTFSWWHGRGAPKALCAGPLFSLACSLDDLTPFLKLRLGKMREAGALWEAARAWKNCPDVSAPGWSGIGCRETLKFFMDEISAEEWLGEWLANTRAYAKRQLTWFRGRKYAIPIRPGDAGAIIAHPLVKDALKACREGQR